MVIDHLNPRFGPVVQLGYVCDDAVEVSRYWAKHFGAGPFHLIEEICFENWTYHGEPQDLPLKITIGNYGSVQLEFIQPLKQCANVYSDIHTGGCTPHHYGLLVPNIAEAAQHLELQHPVTSASVPSGAKLAYFDTRATVGMYTEFIDDIEEVRAIFKMTADDAANWDGKDPIRTISLS